MGADLTLLHTAAGHVARFEALRQRLAPEVEVRHVVHEALLRAATGEDGISPEVRGRVTEEVRALSAGSRVVLCTCSTLGGIAEALDGAYGARVVRVDRPMARRAVEAGPRVALIASLASTLGPTEALLREEAGRAGRTLELGATVVPGAWELFRAGEQEAYLQAVAAHADARSAGADAVVLAQASMDGAERLARTAVPVLSSPATGLLHALELLAERPS